MWQRRLRLWAGVVLFVFLTMHLVNHALAVFGLEFMERVQTLRLAVWQSWPGTIALYGAFAVHVGFALMRMMGRRTWRMPLDEAAQIALGLAIPLLLAGHVIGTRIMGDFFSGDQSYGAVLRSLWWTRPLLQTMLVICAWTHGVIGLDHNLRTKPWFARWRTGAFALAVLVPALALAGFVSGSREALRLHGQPSPLTPQQVAGARGATLWAQIGLAGVAAGLLAALAATEARRRRGGRVLIRYTGHGAVRISRGLSVLEASRMNGIPHPARCGGRARCSTCRVLVTDGLDTLPAPVRPELTMLERISAPRRVRLACQIRPQSDLSVQILLPTLARQGRSEDGDDDLRSFGEEQNITVLVVDMRAFNTLVRRQLPFDLVILLNRYITEMTQTVKAHGGRVETLMTDGLTAIFGLKDQSRAGSRDAVFAARDMLKVCRALNSELGAALPMPLRIGIGIHTGPAIVAQIADPQLGAISLTMGETVSIADRLERATKSMLADCLVSDAALTASGLKLPRATIKEMSLPGLGKSILAHAISENVFEPVPA